MMQAWEYQSIQSWKQGMEYRWSSRQDGFLDEMGRQGWELVSVVERERHMVEWIFKRPKPAVTEMAASLELSAR